jgi:hypothetical protein
MRPATYSTDSPPVPVQDLELQEYIAGLRRRIEVQNVLLEALAEEAKKLKAVLLDLRGHEPKRNMEA